MAYILAVAGATVGFGATWRFPYLVGQNGGGAYVFVFCVAMIVIGIPMILVENAIGRRLRLNAVDAFGGSVDGRKINKIWKIVGYMGLVGAFGIMAYYMVLGGWVLNYIAQISFGMFDLSQILDFKTTSEFYEKNIMSDPMAISFATLVFVLINYVILVQGAVRGIEKSAKYLMPLLFILMLIMIAKNLTLDGAMYGVRFYLTPDFSKINMKLFIDVLGQVFFALSLGFGVMITLSSFVKKDENLVKISVITGILNTLIAVMAGFMIFPSLFSYGVSPDSGPSLVFKSLPIVFSHMPFGAFFAVAFFSLLMIAATNLLSDVTIFGKNIFDAYDAISATIFFVLTSFGSAIFVGWVLKDEAKKEILRGSENCKGIVNFWFWYVKFIIPFIILVLFISSFYDNFLK